MQCQVGAVGPTFVGAAAWAGALRGPSIGVLQVVAAPAASANPGAFCAPAVVCIYNQTLVPTAVREHVQLIP